VALTDALIAALAPDVLVGVGDRPGPAQVPGYAKPFIVLWPDSPVRASVRMDLTTGQTTTIVCHCLGLTEQSARIGEAKLAAAVYGLYQTVVDGRFVQYPEQLASLPLTRDDDVSPPLYLLVVEWRLRTSPAVS
jgi:hypothetical protein